MTGNTFDVLIDKGLGLVGLGIVGYFVKYFFDNVHQRITDVQTANELKFKDILERISSMEGKYRDVLDIVLEKFSKWEDRIMAILGKVGTISQEELMREIDIFKVSAKDDLNTMKMRVERVSMEVKSMSNDMGSAQRQYLLDRMEELNVNLDSRMRNTELIIAKVIKTVTAVNQKQKEHEFKINNLVALKKGSSGDS